MSALFILIAVSLALSAVFLTVCILSIKGGQFDDLESPKWRVLFETETSSGNGKHDPH